MKKDAMLEAIQEILTNAKKYSNQPLTDKLTAKSKVESPIIAVEVEEPELESVEGEGGDDEDDKEKVLAALAKLLG